MTPADEAVLAAMRGEFPRFRIVKKSESPLSRAIDLALKVLSLGRMRTYLSDYRTVIGDTLYVPDDWEELPATDRAICLRHERVHLRQRRRYTMPLFAAAYLFLPLPIGLAYCRARLEWEAYRETLRATFELKGAAAVRDSEARARMIARFTGPAYLWMWPFAAQVGRWYDETLAALER